MSSTLLSSSIRKPPSSPATPSKTVLYGTKKAQMVRKGLIVYVYCAGEEVWKKEFAGEFNSNNFFNNTVHIPEADPQGQKQLAC